MLGLCAAKDGLGRWPFSRRQFDDGMWHPDVAQAPAPAAIPLSTAEATVAAVTSAALATTDAAQPTSAVSVSQSEDSQAASSQLDSATTSASPATSASPTDASNAASKAASTALAPLPTAQLNQTKPPGEKSSGGFKITYLIPVFVVLGLLLLLAIGGRIWGRVSYFREKAIRRRERYERQLAREQRRDRQKAMEQVRQQWQKDGYGAYHEVEKGADERDGDLSDGDGWDSDEEGDVKGPISALGTALGTHLAGREGQLPPPATRDRFGRHEAAVQSNAWWRVQLRRMTTHSNHSDSSLPDGFNSPQMGDSAGTERYSELNRGQSTRSGFARRSGFVSGAEEDLPGQHNVDRRNSQQTQSSGSASTTSTWSRLKLLMRNKSQQSYSTVSGHDEAAMATSASQAWTSLPLRREDTDAGLSRTRSGLLYPERLGMPASQTQQGLSYFSSKRKPPQSLAQLVASASRQGLSSIRQVFNRPPEEADRYTVAGRRARDTRGSHQRLRSEEDWMESGSAPGPYMEIEPYAAEAAPYGQQPSWQPPQGWASFEQVRAASHPRPPLTVDTSNAVLSVPTAALCSPTKGQKLERGLSSTRLSRESSLNGSVVFAGSAFSATSKRTAATSTGQVAHDVFGAVSAVSLPRKASRTAGGADVRRSKTETQGPVRKAPALKTVKSVTFASPRTQQAVEEQGEASAAASMAAGPTRTRSSASGVVKSALKGSSSVTSLRGASQAQELFRSPSKAAAVPAERSILSLYTAAAAGPGSDSSEDEGPSEPSSRRRAQRALAEDEVPGLSSGEGSATDSEWDSEAEAEALEPSSSLLRGHLPSSLGTIGASQHSSMDRRLNAVAQNEKELNQAIEDMMADISPSQETPDPSNAQRARSMPSGANRRLAMAVLSGTDTESESQQGTPMNRRQTWQQSNGRWQRLDSPATSSVASPELASTTPKKGEQPTLPLSLRIGSPPSAFSPTQRFPRPNMAMAAARSPPAATAAAKGDISPSRNVRSPDLFLTSPSLVDLLRADGQGPSQSFGSAMHGAGSTTASPFRKTPTRTKSSVSARTDDSSGSDYAATELSAASGHTAFSSSSTSTAGSPSRRPAMSRKPLRGVA